MGNRRGRDPDITLIAAISLVAVTIVVLYRPEETGTFLTAFGSIFSACTAFKASRRGRRSGGAPRKKVATT